MSEQSFPAADLRHDAKHRPSLLLIFIGLALTAMGQTVLITILGPVSREIGLSEFQTGLIISASALTIVLVSPPWGRASDRLGRKRVFVFALAGFCVTSLGFAMLLRAGLAGAIHGANALTILIAARVFYAMASAGAQPAAGGYIADTSSPENRVGAMALIGAAFGIGSILGPATAFLFSGLGVLIPLYPIAGLGGLCALVAALIMRDQKPAQNQTANVVKLSATDTRIFGMLCGVALVFTAFSMVQQTISFYIQDLGQLNAEQTARQTGMLIAFLALANLATFITVAALKPGPRILLIAGGLYTGGGILLLLYPANLVWLIAAHLCMGIGFGAFLPGVQTKVSLAVDPEHQGAAAGFVSAAMASGFILGPLLGTGLYMSNSIWVFALAAVLAISGCLWAAIAGRSKD